MNVSSGFDSEFDLLKCGQGYDELAENGILTDIINMHNMYAKMNFWVQPFSHNSDFAATEPANVHLRTVKRTYSLQI